MSEALRVLLYIWYTHMTDHCKAISHGPLTHTIDRINQRWGRGTIHSGLADYEADWVMRRRCIIKYPGIPPPERATG